MNKKTKELLLLADTLSADALFLVGGYMHRLGRFKETPISLISQRAEFLRETIDDYEKARALQMEDEDE